MAEHHDNGPTVQEVSDDIHLWSDVDLDTQRQRDVECDERRQEMEKRTLEAEERRKRVQRKLKGLGLRWKQVEQRRLAREESRRSLNFDNTSSN